MIDSEKRSFKEMVEATMSLYQQEVSIEVMKIWWGALAKFPLETVRKAFSRHVQDSKHGRFAPKPADIISIIGEMNPDGRPGADEAWAMYPHDENASAVINSEMADAMSVARPLIEEGDMIAARMAFKDAYNRIVSQNKVNGVLPKWFPSLGHDPEGRKQALDDAVARGRISASHAAALLPPPVAGAIVNALPAMKMLSGKAELTEEQKQAAREKLAEIRAKVGV